MTIGRIELKKHIREGKNLEKGEQKNSVQEVFEVFDSFMTVNLEHNTYACHSCDEDTMLSGMAEKGGYTDIVESLFHGICPKGDDTATLEEYLNPASICRQMAPGGDLLQWEYEDGEGVHKTLFAWCTQREDNVPVRLFLASQNSDCLPEMPGFFTTMEKSLGLLAQMAPDTRTGEEDLTCPGQGKYHGRRVLVVEDNALNRDIVQDLLLMTGAGVDTADNGWEAIGRVAGVPDGYYDMILMDVQMPVMNGYDAVKAIRSLNQRQAERIPIVAMAAGSPMEDSAVSEAGMNGCLTKPVRPGQLMEVMEKFLA